MKVHCDEGVAIHIAPEPCAGVREGASEASVGERIGQPLSRETGPDLGMRSKPQLALVVVLGSIGGGEAQHATNSLVTRLFMSSPGIRGAGRGSRNST